MNIDVYQSAKNRDKFFSVRAGVDVTQLILPSDVDRDFTNLRPYRENMGINASDKRIGMDSADIIRQIEAKGYAMHGVSITMSIKSS